MYSVPSRYGNTADLAFKLRLIWECSFASWCRGYVTPLFVSWILPPVHYRGQKKTPEVFPPSGVSPLDCSTHSPTSWRSPVWSRKTVSEGSGDLSWFGRPQAIKKAAGSAASNKGTNASKVLAWHPAEPPSSGGQRCRGCRLRTAKKKRSGPTRPQFDASSPHRREQEQGAGRNTYWSSPLRPND